MLRITSYVIYKPLKTFRNGSDGQAGDINELLGMENLILCKKNNLWSASFECSLIRNIGFDLKINKLDICAKMSHLRESGVSHFLYMIEGMLRNFLYKNTLLSTKQHIGFLANTRKHT